MTAELIARCFLPAFRNEVLEKLDDQAVVEINGVRLAFTTDAYVVTPLFFPGGDIGDLAVHGTVNDLAMSGARPLFLAASFILEEGFALADLDRIVASECARPAEAAIYLIVTGDTKVVDRGKADGCFITTTRSGRDRARARDLRRPRPPGDVVILSGPIAEHAWPSWPLRADLELETPVASDNAALHRLVLDCWRQAPMSTACAIPRGAAWPRPSTSSRIGPPWVSWLDEAAIPSASRYAASASCSALDPLYVANEGKAAGIVPRRTLRACWRRCSATGRAPGVASWAWSSRETRGSSC